jgi:anti-sigma28 factor (negative regulator of flagellin synthesis)
MAGWTDDVTPEGREHGNDARVSELRRKVAFGAYRVNAERVAAAMLRDPELMARVAPRARRD